MFTLLFNLAWECSLLYMRGGSGYLLTLRYLYCYCIELYKMNDRIDRIIVSKDFEEIDNVDALRLQNMISRIQPRK